VQSKGPELGAGDDVDEEVSLEGRVENEAVEGLVFGRRDDEERVREIGRLEAFLGKPEDALRRPLSERTDELPSDDGDLALGFEQGWNHRRGGDPAANDQARTFFNAKVNGKIASHDPS